MRIFEVTNCDLKDGGPNGKEGTGADNRYDSCCTKAFNQQVKNNIEKFDEDFRFQISRKELEDLVRSKKLTSRETNIFQGQSGGTRYLPWCFTEGGVYMLMTVLKGDLSIFLHV